QRHPALCAPGDRDRAHLHRACIGAAGTLAPCAGDRRAFHRRACRSAGAALEAGLPAAAFRLMKAEFDARYPPERRCAPATDGCWRGQGFPDRAYAFSADGIWDRPAYSRRVTGIDFADPIWLRLGFINENRYNWNSRTSDVERASRNK